MEMDDGRREKECNSSFGKWEGSLSDNQDHWTLLKPPFEVCVLEQWSMCYGSGAPKSRAGEEEYKREKLPTAEYEVLWCYGSQRPLHGRGCRRVG